MVEAATAENYGQSLSTARRLGKYAVENSLLSLEGQAVFELSFADFTTSIEENLKTDPEFRASLDVEAPRTHEIIDGLVCAADGTPMRDLIWNGLEASRVAAEADPRMRLQVIRDEGDYANALAVDALPVGTARIVLSMDPKDGLRQDPEFWEGYGYREGIAYLQWYAKTTDTVAAGAYSVDLSDLDTWRQTFADFGIDVPADESPNTWIRQAIERQLSPAETAKLALEIRAAYYAKQAAVSGSKQHRRSVSEYVAANQTILRSLFELQYQKACEASYTGQKNEVVDGFVGAMLGQSDNLKPEMRRRLIGISNRQKFDDDDARFLEAAIRYGAVEQLRQGLGDYISAGIVASEPPPLAAYKATQTYNQQFMNQLLATNIDAGARAGRSYGGCAEAFNPGREAAANGDFPNGDNKQGIYGGAGDDKAETGSNAGVIRCINCRSYVPKEKVVKPDCWKCPKCLYKVDICDGKVLEEGETQEHRRAAKVVSILDILKDKQKIRRSQTNGRGRLALAAV